MQKNDKVFGKTTIDPKVILTMIRLTTLSVPGVSKMAVGVSGIDDLVNKFYSNGVRIEVENNTVYADIYVELFRDVKLKETAKKIQESVQRAILEMVGMDVGHINIHIEDIELPVNNQ